MTDYKLIQPGCIYSYNAQPSNVSLRDVDFPCFKIDEQMRLMPTTKAIIVPMTLKEQPYIVSLIQKKTVDGRGTPVSYWGEPEVVVNTIATHFMAIARHAGLGLGRSTQELVEIAIGAHDMLVNAKSAIEWVKSLDKRTQSRLLLEAQKVATR